MITIETLCVALPGLRREDVEQWVAQDWVRPQGVGVGAGGGWQFGEIDVARVRLIHELRDELRVDEQALPVVLNLLDQLYDARRRMMRLRDAIESAAPEDIRDAVLRAFLAGRAG